MLNVLKSPSRRQHIDCPYFNFYAAGAKRTKQSRLQPPSSSVHSANRSSPYPVVELHALPREMSSKVRVSTARRKMSIGELVPASAAGPPPPSVEYSRSAAVNNWLSNAPCILKEKSAPPPPSSRSSPRKRQINESEKEFTTCCERKTRRMHEQTSKNGPATRRSTVTDLKSAGNGSSRGQDRVQTRSASTKVKHNRRTNDERSEDAKSECSTETSEASSHRIVLRERPWRSSSLTTTVRL